ncbi:unnamed protein product [Adineta ricciae]|uniref:Mesoderm induction early response protein 1 n=1 Tax=Adineta ricciae TaxID=249248 RepID=A0A813Y561_ADIRI|nr:unnamed protein product [Adineta ricciae]CAF0950373.1 unnamed protein product [Adineta ricciae]
MASNSTDPSTKDDDEYQAGYDEEDDEQTIEEEEQFGDDDEQNELDDLEADANMPLDELLKMYGQNAPVIHNIPHSHHDTNTSSDDDEDENNRPPQLHHLLHVNGRLLPDNDDDDDDTDDSFEPEIIKTIRVGEEYQAEVEPQAEFDSTNENSDDRELPVDEILWSPSSVDDDMNENIDEYLKTIRSEYPLSDDEISLQTLFNCQMNTETALTKFRQLPVKTIYSYPEWSLDEIQSLEEGLRVYGKNFFKISEIKCPNRSVREVIHFYYQWKKSERYQLFMEEQQRLTAITSVTDMIEKLIEEQEQQLCTAVGVINSTNSSSVLTHDLKRNSPNSSISIVTICQQETSTTTTSKRAFDQVDNDTDPPTKKSSLNSNNSPTATIV